MTIAASLLKPGGIFFVTTVQKPILMTANNTLRHALMRLGLPAGRLLSTYHCLPSAYRRLARMGGIVLLECLEFNDAPGGIICRNAGRSSTCLPRQGVINSTLIRKETGSGF